jgi:hypothetical protein
MPPSRWKTMSPSPATPTQKCVVMSATMYHCDDRCVSVSYYNAASMKPGALCDLPAGRPPHPDLRAPAQLHGGQACLRGTEGSRRVSMDRGGASLREEGGKANDPYPSKNSKPESKSCFELCGNILRLPELL